MRDQSTTTDILCSTLPAPMSQYNKTYPSRLSIAPPVQIHIVPVCWVNTPWVPVCRVQGDFRLAIPQVGIFSRTRQTGENKKAVKKPWYQDLLTARVCKIKTLTSIRFVSKLAFLCGGGGESRTPVRKPFCQTFYERSRWINIPSPDLPPAGYRL